MAMNNQVPSAPLTSDQQNM